MEMGRLAKFYDHLFSIDKPEGTTISLAHGQSPAANRNAIIDMALEVDATHIFFIDDDVLIPKDALTRLLAHDKDIVSGLYLMRNFPHAPIAFNAAMSDGKCRFKFLNENETGLVEVVGFGLGCCLIKTDVFKVMERPWIRIGQLDPQNWNDDIDFFNRARDLHDYKLYLDLDIQCGHACTVTLWPVYKDGKWVTIYDSQGVGNAAFLAATPQQIYGNDEYERHIEEHKHLVTKEF